MHNITIGIPTYKRPLLLKRALNSILKSKVKKNTQIKIKTTEHSSADSQ